MFKLLYLLISLACAASAYAADGAQILEKVDRNMAPAAYELYRKLINIEPNGAKKEYVLFTVKKGKDMVAGVFLSPASEKGRSTLRLGDNMSLCIPNVGKPVRITSLQSVVGRVSDNADILALDYSDEYDVAGVEELEKEYVLDLKAKTKTVAYDRLKMWVDREKVVPTQIECQTEAGMLIKTLYFKDTQEFGGGFVSPAVVETDSPLYKGYRSIMIYAKIKARGSMTRSLPSPTCRTSSPCADDFVNNPISALRFLLSSLRRTKSTPHSARFARLELGLFTKPSVRKKVDFKTMAI